MLSRGFISARATSQPGMTTCSTGLRLASGRRWRGVRVAAERIIVLPDSCRSGTTSKFPISTLCPSSNYGEVP
jgi:hypothetical protein